MHAAGQCSTFAGVDYDYCGMCDPSGRFVVCDESPVRLVACRPDQVCKDSAGCVPIADCGVTRCEGDEVISCSGFMNSEYVEDCASYGETCGTSQGAPACEPTAVAAADPNCTDRPAVVPGFSFGPCYYDDLVYGCAYLDCHAEGYSECAIYGCQ